MFITPSDSTYMLVVGLRDQIASRWVSIYSDDYVNVCYVSV